MSAPSPTPRRIIVLALAFSCAGLVLASVLRAGRLTSSKAVTSRSSSSPRASTSAPGTTSAETLPSAAPVALLDETPDTLAAQREVLFRNMKSQLGLSETELAATREVFAGSRWMGQGNPKITQHPMSRAECQGVRSRHKLQGGDVRCGARNMVPLFEPGVKDSDASARVCIDQYEFPNIACDYPVSWVKSDEAQRLCQAQGKRLCDAHEWEGGCAGALLPAEQEYTFGERRLMQEYVHNKERQVVWAYGKLKDHARCATGSAKSPKCFTPSWELCGTNSYPAGAFPECVSPLGVYDQHGNVAEHMNLPLVAEELGTRGGTGENEMKGSWFIFGKAEAHEDDCRWRALAWHAGKLMADDAHRNYHLGFRCCKDLPTQVP